MLWQDLVKNALLGTENSRFNEPTLEALAQLGIDTAQEPPLLLANAAALLTQMRRAGFLLHDFQGEMPAASIHDASKQASPKSTHHLHLILKGTHRAVLPEWLALLAKSGKTLPTAELPALMRQPDINLLWPQLQPLLGEAGHWLLRQHPDWSARLQDPSQFNWQTGKRAERVALLQFWREQSLGFALQLLRSTWESESLADKMAFLPTLERGLSLDDEPFLESCLDNKRQEVREQAARLLAKVSGSLLSQRMKKRAADMLHWNGKKLTVHLSDELDDNAQRDGILKFKQKEGTGASYIAQVMAQVPPSHWEGYFGCAPLEALRLFATTDWCSSLVSGLLKGLINYASPTWAAALVEFWQEKEDLTAWESYTDLTLFQQVSQADVNRLALRFLNETNDLPTEQSLVYRLLKNNPATWSDELSLLIVKRFRKEIVRDYRQFWQLPHLNGYLQMLGLRCNPGLFDELQTGWSNDAVQWRMWEKPVEEILSRVLFRREMAAEM